jgi:hypothetical protein
MGQHNKDYLDKEFQASDISGVESDQSAAANYCTNG